MIATRIVTLIIAVAKIWSISIKAPMMTFVILIAIQLVLNSLTYLAFYSALSERVTSWQFCRKRAISMLKVSWPLIFSSLAATPLSEVDTVMLGQMTDNQAVGIYGEAVKFSKMWYFVPAAIAASVYPELMRAQKSLSPNAYRRRTQLYFDVLSGVGYLSATLMTLAAPLLVHLLYTSEFLDLGRVMSIHVWTAVSVALRQGLDRWLMAENSTQYAMWLSFIGSLLNILLNLWLIPTQGIIGAAWATVIANFVPIGLVGILSPKLRSIAWQLVLALSIPFPSEAIHKG